MTPLSVLYLFSGDLWAGAEVMLFNLLSSLKEEDSLRIIALSLNEGVLAGRPRNAGIETHVIPEDCNSMLKIYGKALSLLKTKRIDIIHSHRYKENLLALPLGKSLGVKQMISTVHGLSESALHPLDKRNPASLKARLNYYILNKFFTRIVAVSQDMRTLLIRNYKLAPHKLDVIYNGIPIPENDRHTAPPSGNPGRTSSRSFHIGTVGRLAPVKGFDLFLNVAAGIRKHTGNVRFSILGDGPLRGHLIKRAGELGIKDCIEFLPPRHDPLPYYRSLDLYLNTSVHEGIPMSILEAMACKRPVVAPNVGGIPEIILHGKHGFLVDGRRPEDFINSCMELVRSGRLRTKVGDNASKRIASSFISSKTAQSYRKLYAQSCTENRTGQGAFFQAV